MTSHSRYMKMPIDLPFHKHPNAPRRRQLVTDIRIVQGLLEGAIVDINGYDGHTQDLGPGCRWIRPYSRYDERED